jgi:hypothetical protein
MDIKAGTYLVVTGKLTPRLGYVALTRAGPYKFFVRMRFDPLNKLDGRAGIKLS